MEDIPVPHTEALTAVDAALQPMDDAATAVDQSATDEAGHLAEDHLAEGLIENGDNEGWEDIEELAPAQEAIAEAVKAAVNGSAAAVAEAHGAVQEAEAAIEEVAAVPQESDALQQVHACLVRSSDADASSFG